MDRDGAMADEGTIHRSDNYVAATAQARLRLQSLNLRGDTIAEIEAIAEQLASALTDSAEDYMDDLRICRAAVIDVTTELIDSQIQAVYAKLEQLRAAAVASDHDLQGPHIKSAEYAIRLARKSLRAAPFEATLRYLDLARSELDGLLAQSPWDVCTDEANGINSSGGAKSALVHEPSDISNRHAVFPSWIPERCTRVRTPPLVHPRASVL